MSGPVPKRSDERLGHPTQAKGADPVTTVPSSGALTEWPEPDRAWHPVAKEWFASLGESGQRVFYQPSDVARAKYIAVAMSKNLKQGKFSAVLFAAVNSAAAELLDTEGARRRLRVEIEKAKPEDPAQKAAVASLDDARARLTAKSG